MESMMIGFRGLFYFRWRKWKNRPADNGNEQFTVDGDLP
jgi:hypothetical protein